MLRGIHKATSTWVGKTIMGVVMGGLIVSFAIWGVGDIFRGFGQNSVVKVGGMTLPKIMDCANESGWKYTTDQPPYTGIEVCGAACADLKIAGQADVEYYCDAG